MIINFAYHRQTWRHSHCVTTWVTSRGRPQISGNTTCLVKKQKQQRVMGLIRCNHQLCPQWHETMSRGSHRLRITRSARKAHAHAPLGNLRRSCLPIGQHTRPLCFATALLAMHIHYKAPRSKALPTTSFKFGYFWWHSSVFSARIMIMQ